MEIINKMIRFLLPFFLSLLFGFLSLSPAFALIKRYVMPGGWDDNAGDSVLTAYGSITKAVQALSSTSLAAVSDDIEIYIAAGTYATDNFTFNSLNNFSTIRFIGDPSAQVFTTPGDVILQFNATSAVYGVFIVNQQIPLGFENLDFKNAGQALLAIQASSQVTFSKCTFTGDSNAFNGIKVDANSNTIVVDSCIISKTNVGLLLDQSYRVTMQNCYVTDNNTGIQWIDTHSCALINNYICNQIQYGLRIESKNLGSVIFNNIITNNATQIYTDFLATYVYQQTGTDSQGDPIYDYLRTWSSSGNVITPITSQIFADANGTLIYNQKQWQEAAHRDYWAQSLSYPMSFTSPTTAISANSDMIFGHGLSSFNGFTAPSYDMNGNARPLKGLDAGCIEINENSMPHHYALSAGSSHQPPGVPITITSRLKDSTDQDISLHPLTKPLYVFLAPSSASTAVDSKGIITDSTSLLESTGTNGLYIMPLGDTFSSPCQFNIHRTVTSNSGSRYYLRTIEWDDWNAGNVTAYGGIGNGNNAGLFWTNPPDPDLCQITATPSLLASGLRRHHAEITVKVVDSNGAVIPDLYNNDITFAVSGGSVGWYNFDEVSSSPGTYHIFFDTAQTGPRTITITVIGQILTTTPVVEAYPGLYGVITSAEGNMVAADVQVTVMAGDYTVLGSTTADSSGQYSVMVPAANGSEYIVRVVDPHGHFPQKDMLVSIPGGTAREYNITLEPIPAHATLEAHAYPNPAHQGRMLTVPYNLPKSGHFKLMIYDLRGRLVMTLFDGPAAAGQGQFNWPGVNEHGERLAPGTYRLVMSLDGAVATARIVIVP